MPVLVDLDDGVIKSATCNESAEEVPVLEAEIARMWAVIEETNRSLKEELAVAAGFRTSIVQELSHIRTLCDPIRERTADAGDTEISTDPPDARRPHCKKSFKCGSFIEDSIINDPDFAKQFYTVTTTARDAFLLVNLHPQSDHEKTPAERRQKLKENIALYLTVGLTFAYQILMSLIVALSLQRDTPIDDELVENVRRWRLKHAHDFTFADPTSHASLASLVCNEDRSLSVASYQSFILADVRDYMHPFAHVESIPVGLVTLASVIFLWTLMVAHDLVECVGFLNAVQSLPMGRSRLVSTGSRCKVTHISRKRRLLASLVGLLEMIIDVVLLISGIVWLRSTSSIEDMILNSVALSFFFSVDEIIFELIAWSRTTSLVNALDPLPLSPPCKVLGFRQVAALTVAVSTVVFGMSHTAYILNVMERVEQEACGGDIDFVVARSPLGEFMFSVAPAIGSESATGLALQDVVDKLRTADGSRDKLYDYANQGWIWAGSYQFIHSQLNTGIESRVNGLWCQDTKDATYFNPYTSTGDLAVMECSQAKPYCSGGIPVIRSFCPVTCGCDNPFSGLTISAPEFGCPRSCQKADSYLAKIQTVECADWTPQALENHKGWQYFLLHAPNLDTDGWTLLTTNPQSSVGEVVQGHGFEGCEMIRKYARGLCSFGARSFCPMTCDCPRSHKLGCPTSCRNASGTL